MRGAAEIIDAHHHVWRQTDLPWLLGPTQPRIFGAYDAIKRDYLIDEYKSEATPEGVVQSIYVQANWAPNWYLDEAKWVQSIAETTGWPHGVIAFSDLTDEQSQHRLKQLSNVALVKGIRQQLHWHNNPLYRFAKRPDLASDQTFQRNVSRLAEYGWTFELQVFLHQIDSALSLVMSCPDVTFVLQHAGMLEDLSDNGLAQWRNSLGRLAGCSNVVCKLSGLGTFIRSNDPSHIAMVMHEAIALFGPERCMFGSNFPIEKIWTTYQEMIAAYKNAAASLPENAQRAIFFDTACRVYRL